MSSFSQFDAVASEIYTTFVERTPQNNDIQCHSRSSTLVLNTSASCLIPAAMLKDLADFVTKFLCRQRVHGFDQLGKYVDYRVAQKTAHFHLLHVKLI